MGGAWGGDIPSPEIFFGIFALEMVRFDALRSTF